jgi:hypothetical protein
MNFKPGDLVIGNEERTKKLMDKYGITGIKGVKLKVLKVLDCDQTSGRTLMEYKGRRSTFNTDEFRLATEGEIKKQNIGEIFKK